MTTVRRELARGHRDDFEGISTVATFVGWLGPEHEARGVGDRRLVQVLARALFGHIEGASERRVVRSIEPCPLCGATVYISEDGTIASGRTDEESSAARRRAMDAGGDWTVLGHSDLWVSHPDEGHFVAPGLVIHFVADHGYEPPRVFVERLEGLEKA